MHFKVLQWIQKMDQDQLKAKGGIIFNRGWLLLIDLNQYQSKFVHWLGLGSVDVTWCYLIFLVPMTHLKVHWCWSMVLVKVNQAALIVQHFVICIIWTGLIHDEQHRILGSILINLAYLWLYKPKMFRAKRHWQKFCLLLEVYTSAMHVHSAPNPKKQTYILMLL